MNGNPTRNLLVIKASAGSGKTYQLAQQYIRHLLFARDENGALVPRRAQGDNRLLNAHRLLLAITFTNKATDVMKSRIVKELHCLAQPGTESDYLADFMRESRLSEERVRALARQALNELLFDYSNFNVSTIDSFFQSILRNFARELDRDFNYDIQLEEKYAVRVAIHNFLQSLGQEDKPTQVDRWVRDYQYHLVHGVPNKVKWRFFDDGGDFLSMAKQINTELFRSRMDDIRDYLGRIDPQTGEFVSDFSRIREFQKYIHDLGPGLDAAIDEAKQEIWSIVSRHADYLRYSLANLYKAGPDAPYSERIKDFDETKFESQFKKGASVTPEEIGRLKQLFDRYFALLDAKEFYSYIGNKLGLLGMMAMIDVYLERYRHETNSILIGDTNDLIGTVLESGTDFVYERVGTLIAHFMIDEFQDTSTKQYSNFIGLIRESLAGGNFNMLIGDAKQSIYRFRNADPTVFRERVDKDFADDIWQPQLAPGAPSSVNYRSSRAIIEFNNALFEYVSRRYSGDAAVRASYGDVRQGMPASIDQDKVPGYVKVMFGKYDRLVAGTANGSTETGGSDNKVDVTDILPAYLLELHQRYDWGEIGILVDTNNQGNKIVESILEYNRNTQGEPISIISGESLLLNNSPMVRRIIAMLRFIDISHQSPDEEDGEPAQGKRDARYYANRKRESDQRMFNALNQFIKDTAAHPDGTPETNGLLLKQALDRTLAGVDPSVSSGATLESMLPAGDELTTLVSVVESIITMFKQESTDSRDVDKETAFLLAFQDAVMAFMGQRNGGSVREFLKYWDDMKDKLAINSPSTSDAVKIMTIHAAKGLEFDCVIIPYAEWELDDNRLEKDYWIPRDVFLDTLSAVGVDPQSCDSAIVPPLLNVPKSRFRTMLNAGLPCGPKAKDYYASQMSAVLIDNLNKTYVAMTRPCSELHVFCQNDKYNDVKPLLEDFIGDTQLLTPIPDADGQPTGWYELGTMSTREELAAKRKAPTQTAIQEPITEYVVAPIPERLQVRVEHASSRHIQAGKRLHAVLSRIHDRDDLERVIDQAVKHGTITSDPDDPCGIDHVMSHVRQPILDTTTRISAWFDPANKVYSERTITSASDSLWDEDGIQNLRPDRIIRRPDGQIIVIDYKSGQRDDKRYCRQVLRYIDKLRTLFPGASISGRIWYIAHDLVIDERGTSISI